MRKVMLFAFLCFSAQGFAGNPPIVKYAEQLKGKYFKLRTHEVVLGSPSLGRWNSRPIYTLYATDHTPSWAGRYFVSEHEFFVKSVDYSKGSQLLTVKMWTTGGEELKFCFSAAKNLKPNEFDQMFFQVFFRPDENIPAFIAENNKNLIDHYLDGEPDLSSLAYEDKLKILRAAQYAEKSSRPAVEHLEDGFYLRADLAADPSVYNDIRVTKAQRIASSIESKAGKMKQVGNKASGLPKIKGICFSWRIYHEDPLNETSLTSNYIKAYVPLNALRDFVDGSLSPLELVNCSLLHVDGTKLTFASWDPIGAR